VSNGNSYRQILRSTSIIGGASIINIAVGLLRTKVAAVLLGPAGVGIIGLFQSLLAIASSVSSLGFGSVGTRQIAEATGRLDLQVVAAARRALFWGTLGLAALGTSIFWLVRDILAETVLGNVGFKDSLGWLALGVGLTVVSGSQTALLNGLRRMGDIARVSVFSALLSTILGVASLCLWGDKGVVAFVLSTPLATFLIGRWYVSRLPKVVASPTSLSQMIGQWKTLARLGTAFTIAGLVETVGLLAVRTCVEKQLGAEALGHFQAAWLISMTYIGFVLQAMGTDYYPRLAANISNNAATNRLVNEQTEVALLLAGPAFVAMLGFAPWVIELLYSSQFDEAVVVLRWQVLGDILKVACWPLGFIVLAAGAGRTFMLLQTLGIATLVIFTWIGVPLIGLQATGVASLAMYLVYLPAVYWLAWRRTGFSWLPRIAFQLFALMAASVLVFLCGVWSTRGAAVFGLLATLLFGVYGLARIGHMLDLKGPLRHLAAMSKRVMISIGVWHE